MLTFRIFFDFELVVIYAVPKAASYEIVNRPLEILEAG